MNNFGGNTAGQPAQAGTGQQDALGTFTFLVAEFGFAALISLWNPLISLHIVVSEHDRRRRIDDIDKGVSSLMTKAGHGGQSASTTEKISDGIRTGFKKMTGKVSISPSIPCAVLTYLDVPIKECVASPLTVADLKLTCTASSDRENREFPFLVYDRKYEVVW
jgi:hypothetical protein